ncbi:SDR family oxidoreductase [Amycolatopsis sp. NPDC051061]|uniref:SDR family oxidoreductase n=1 Tax=Amycolatopsis sp. NPDC051061 TaxID=3155042 RepID=UPI00343E8150
MYAVTGAGGKFGRLAIDALLARGVPAREIVAVVRTPGKITDLADRGVVVRTGDYDTPDSWPSALAGIETLLLVSGDALGRRVRQHTTVIDAAKAAGVRRIAYTSILKADTSTIALAPEHLATEQVLRRSGLAYTFLRNSWYFENYLDQADRYIAQGALVSAAGSAGFAAATRADFAAAAAAVLVEDGHDNVVHELGGEKITFADLAAAISRASGAEVSYRAVSPDELRAILRDADVPEGYAELLIDADRAVVAGELDTDSQELARLVGHPLTTLTDAATATLRPSGS